jgi:hypothetical protein
MCDCVHLLENITDCENNAWNMYQIRIEEEKIRLIFATTSKTLSQLVAQATAYVLNELKLVVGGLNLKCCKKNRVSD